jgi:hypothetical protein
VEHDFSGVGEAGGDTPPNSRQRSSPDATHEVNTQTPYSQGNMGRVVAVFDVSFACSGRLCVEFALSLPFFGH